MNSKSKIVDLEMSDDGTYAPKGSKPTKASKPSKIVQKKEERKRVVDGADEFLGGLDEGLDFVENISLRVNRILNLRW